MQTMHLLLAAVTLLTQGAGGGRPPRAPRLPRMERVPDVAVVGLPALILPDVTPLVEGAQRLADVAEGLQGMQGLEALDGLTVSLDDDAPHMTLDRRPPPGWAQSDPADSLWRAARRAFNRGDYDGAASLFNDIIRRFPRSTYTADSHYWAAFALYKNGGSDNLRQARTLLLTQERRYPQAATRPDAGGLLAQIQTALAKEGDEQASIWIRQHAAAVAAGTAPTVAARAAPAIADAVAQGTARAGCPSGDDDDDVRMQALNGLLQMDAENALPILKRVLAKRDPCSAGLRRKAVFLVAQKQSGGTEDVLLDVAQHDPDGDVRGQAVFWLSQVNSERSVDLLDSILRSSTDEELQEKALFALSQQNSPRAGAALRAFAERPGASVEARGKAIFWLGQQHNDANTEYLRGLYAKLTDEDLKNKVIFSLSQMGGAENMRWLMGIVLDEHEDVEMRKKALFWAGQSNEADLTQLTGLYDHMQNEEMKNQLIFVLAQRHEGAALDKLMDIARRETNRDLRKKALFWIGQSHDPRAARFLEEIIDQ